MDTVLQYFWRESWQSFRQIGPGIWYKFTKVHNLGQKVGGKFTNLSKIGFSMECFTADFLIIFTEKNQRLAFGLKADYSPSNSSISGIFLKFSNFLRS